MESASDSDAEEVEELANIPSQLDKFREQWQVEIQSRNVTEQFDRSSGGSSPVPKPAVPENQSAYEKAKELFMNGVWSEKNGLVYEAMEYYRKATKIVPDIDIQMTDLYRQTMLQAGNAYDSEHDEGETSFSLGEDRCEITDLCSHFNHLCSSNEDRITRYCSMANQQKSTHISSLPSEILTYILRWVISADVDSRSLERFSKVCRGFYVLARDPCIWHNICTRIWGLGCQSHQPYPSWRSMFIERPHLYFHGVYMNKVELYRQGEATVDKYYPPWLKVVYYRYLRFFADGLMFMLTSSSDPVSVISQLRSPAAHIEGMCKGMYRIKDNQISCILRRVKRKESKTQRKYKRQQVAENVDSEMKFYLDLSLLGNGSQPNVVLQWEKYSISIFYPDTLNESSSDFALTNKDFPPCNFARVKSYMSESSSPLTSV